MVTETVEYFANAARNKFLYLKENFVGYFILSLMAGVYIGLGIMLIFSLGAPLAANGTVGVKTLMGFSFCIALTLIIFAGAELFTGNNMIMTIGALSKKVTWKQVLVLWIVCYLGNLIGSLALAYIITLSGLTVKPELSSFIFKVCSSKMNAPFMELFFRGILCNMLVCLAIWMCTRAKDDTAKILLIFLCLFAFISSGYEHSIANMTLMGLGIFNPLHPASVSWTGYFYNLLPVTAGNIVGGAGIIGAAYWFVPNNNIKEIKNFCAIPIKSKEKPITDINSCVALKLEN
ncbi:MAG: formate/nitrite transporter family protein [bacterium]|nr:formate/nitrite transporter family protein [bacterium]